jgi:hypothetical protein
MLLCAAAECVEDLELSDLYLTHRGPQMRLRLQGEFPFFGSPFLSHT